jgi:hypothetical protein
MEKLGPGENAKVFGNKIRKWKDVSLNKKKNTLICFVKKESACHCRYPLLCFCGDGGVEEEDAE